MSELIPRHAKRLHRLPRGLYPEQLAVLKRASISPVNDGLVAVCHDCFDRDREVGKMTMGLLQHFLKRLRTVHGLWKARVRHREVVNGEVIHPMMATRIPRLGESAS